MNPSLVEIDNLTYQFSDQKNPALKNITASIPQGKIVGLVGPDGAGKTTLIRLIAGLLKPSNGSIRVCGHDTIKEAESVHYLSGYMPQKFGLYEDLTVQQNLNLYAALRDVFGEEKQATFEKLLHFTNLKQFSHRLARDLSGGMKQKLGLACALIKKPSLLLLDEPSVGVDPLSRRELWKMVENLLDEGISILWSSAYLEEAERCHSVLLLNNAELLFNGDPQILTKRMEGRVFSMTPTQEEKRAALFKMLKEKNVLDGIIQGGSLRLVLKESEPQPSMTRVKPRFEDGFIDILGGGPGADSKLAERAPLILIDETHPIIADQLTKKFGDFTAVETISLTVKKGEIFGLLGPNGSGKTTLFKMLCALLSPTSGKGSINNLDVKTAGAQARSKVGYMAQKFSLYGNLSVKQNLSFFAGIYDLKAEEKRQAIEEMVAIFNLKEYLTISAEKLPLGYKQRLSLACATMHHPEVLFLDEPTSGVDPLTRREFWNHINGLVRKGVTIMITTHFMEEAEYCDRIALIYQGKIIKTNTPDALKLEIQSDQNPHPSLEDAFIAMILKEQMEMAK